MMTKISFEDACILETIKLARFLVRRLPPAVSYAAARGIGALIAFFSKRSRIAYKNLRMALSAEKSPSELRRLARLSIENLTMSLVDLLRIPDMTQDTVRQDFAVSGESKFLPYLKRGGILFLTGHFGSWELLNIAAGLKGYPMVALARVQKHPRSDAYLNSLRRSKGSQVIHKGMPVREILRALRAGKIVGILSDQDGGKKGRFVRFMGRLSSTPPGAATFSLRTGAPIFPAFIFRESGGRYRIEVEGPLEMPGEHLPPEQAEVFLLQQFASILEEKVRLAPEQWLWAHRRWKSSPDKKVLILSDGKAGHLNQALAVLDAIRRERKKQGHADETLSHQIIQLRFRDGALPKIARLLGQVFRGRLPFGRFWLKKTLAEESYRTVTHSYGDVILSCGASLTQAHLWLKRENQAKSVVVMRPPVPERNFDAVIAPKHDHPRSAANIFATEGALSAIRPEDAEAEGRRLSRDFALQPGVKRIGLLVGGDTAQLRFEAASFGAAMRALAGYCRPAHVQILATSSRRTPRWAEEAMRKIFSGKTECPFLLIQNESARPGAVAAILHLADALVVSGESMSMVSEAVSSGKPVLVISPWTGRGLKKKYEDFLSRLEKQGRILRSTPEHLEAALNRALQAEGFSNDYRLQEELVLSSAVKRMIAG